MNSTSSDYVIISKNELDIRKGEIVFTGADAEELIEHKEVFIKFINKCINKVQADLGSLVYVKREAEAVLEINTLREAIKSIDKTIGAYKGYIQKIEEEKEQAKKDKEALQKAIAEQEQK